MSREPVRVEAEFPPGRNLNHPLGASMHRRYEPLKSHNNRMQSQIDPAQAERLMGELTRMFDHVFREDVMSATKSSRPAISDLSGADPGAVSKRN